MDLYDFAYAIATGVAQDTALQAWATTNFGSAMHVYLGMSTEDMPSIDDAPFVVIEEMSRSCGQESRDIGYSMGCWMMLSDANHETVADNNLTILAGGQLISDGLRLMRLAVASNLPAGIVIGDVDQYADCNANGAEVIGYMAFSFIEHLTMGNNPLE